MHFMSNYSAWFFSQIYFYKYVLLQCPKVAGNISFMYLYINCCDIYYGNVSHTLVIYVLYVSGF